MLPAEQARFYREKAAEFRRLADRLSAPGAKKDIEALAILYERLADTIEAIETRRIRKISK